MLDLFSFAQKTANPISHKGWQKTEQKIEGFKEKCPNKYAWDHCINCAENNSCNPKCLFMIIFYEHTAYERDGW